MPVPGSVGGGSVGGGSVGGGSVGGGSVGGGSVGGGSVGGGVSTGVGVPVPAAEPVVAGGVGAGVATVLAELWLFVPPPEVRRPATGA